MDSTEGHSRTLCVRVGKSIMDVGLRIEGFSCGNMPEPAIVIRRGMVMIWIMGSLAVALLANSCGSSPVDDPLRISVRDAVSQGNVDYREPPPVSHLPQLPDRPLARHEVAAAKRVIIHVGERLFAEGGRTEMANLVDPADTSGSDRVVRWGSRLQPSDLLRVFAQWMEEQGCIASYGAPTASAEGSTVHLIITTYPPQLPMSIDLRVRSEDGSATTERHQLRVRLGTGFRMVPVE